MSIVKYLPELPENNSVVYADNGNFASDRAIFVDGKFMGGGEFPIPEYEMTNVSKWFYMDEYHKHQGNRSCYFISFDEAEKLQ